MDSRIQDHSLTVISARSSRFSAMQMDIGNIISMLLPPLPVLWFGISMLIYALNRHHPDEKVGHYVQWAAYRFYGVMGLVIPVGTFFPGDGFMPWLIAWGLGLALIVPSSLWAIWRIRKDRWQDIELPPAEEELHNV